MHATEIQISQFLAKNGTKFIIPVYQRNYDWKQRQCQQLLTDLQSVSASTNAYFIGSIVHQSKRNLTTNTELIIIDGQQRITTLTLLLYVLCKRFRQFGEIQTADYIEEVYLINKFDANQNKLKLKPVNQDDLALQNVINGNLEEIPQGNRIRENYEFFLNKIQSLNDAEKYYQAFPKLTVVEISLDERDDPQKIFQSLNSTGLELSQADLIRNYILMNLPYDQQENFYDKYWSKIEKNCRNQQTFESELSMFMRDYLTLKFNRIPSKSAVYDQFKESHPDVNQDEQILESLLAEMLRFAKFYSALINNHNNYSAQIKSEIKNINKLDVSVSYPFLLGVMDELDRGQITQTEFLNILILIQSFVLRRFLCNLPSNSLQKIFMTLFANAKKAYQHNPSQGFDQAVAAVLLKLSSYQRFPSDRDVALALEQKDIYRAQWRKRDYLLEKLENHYQPFRENTVDLSQREDITIEHIFPQNPSTDFITQLGQEQFEEMKRWSNTLGNLTLVINNSSLGNRTFIDKRDLNKEDSKGFRYSKFNLNSSLQELEKWDLDELKKRTSLLTEKVLEIWQYPRVDLQSYLSPDDLPIDIFEIDDPTNTQPKAVLINGSKQVVKTNREMYTHLIEYLYAQEPEIFHTPAVKTTLAITNQPSHNRVTAELDGMYYDVGMSARSIFNRIKQLLTHTQQQYTVQVQLRETANQLDSLPS